MRNYAIINTTKLVENAKKVKSKLKDGVKLCAVVKADAYGHGAERCANELYNICDYFAVAILEEGIALRLSGIDKDILILNPIFSVDIERAVFYNFTLTVCSLDNLKEIIAEATRQNRKAKVHVKLNCGMNRNGVDSIKEVKDILDYATKSGVINIDGIFSHLPCPENDKKVNGALNKFLLANKLIKGYNNRAICHLSASGGFIKGLQFDMVRIGILLYGYTPFQTDYIQVEPIMKIYAPILCRRKLKQGDSILYGENILKEDCVASIIRYGYADGLFRKESGNLLNNRCMDISAYNGVNTNKYYCVMDNADKIAKENGTISYEILTKSTIRADKIYIK